MAACEHMQWWHEARYGMFIHWGVYSIPARGEWVMYQEHIPADEYAPLAKRFAPKEYDPDQWVALAKKAGEYRCWDTNLSYGFTDGVTVEAFYLLPYMGGFPDGIMAYRAWDRVCFRRRKWHNFPP